MSTVVRGRRPLLVLHPGRRAARAVRIGDVWIGGEHPIAIQSMTTTRTADAAATADQVAALARAGSDLVRVTVPSGPDAAALPEIRARLAREGVRVPLIADIHFTPKLALEVCDHVEKVRINPGNFADKKQIGGGDYDETRWRQDVERMHALFAPVVDRARERGVALRIGTNHGSLSDRIVHRFGDSPEGMVESALEFVAICEDRGHRELVISMKASNTQVMVVAYRLLAARLDARLAAGGDSYPLHLGVTEAGGGDEGRIKSSVGIATLLAEGLGDTIRVSLTEDPVHEIPVARTLVERFARPERADDRARESLPPTVELVASQSAFDPQRRHATRCQLGPVAWGGTEPPRVELLMAPHDAPQLAAAAMTRPPVELIDMSCSSLEEIDGALERLGRVPRARIARGLTLTRPVGELLVRPDLIARLKTGVDRLAVPFDPGVDPSAPSEVMSALAPLAVLWLIPVTAPWDASQAQRIVDGATRLAGCGRGAMVGLDATTLGPDAILAHRWLATALDRAGARLPLVLSGVVNDAVDPRVDLGGAWGALLVDGVGDAVRLTCHASAPQAIRLAHQILQAARCRLEQAEYIACPSCGRTLFDLESTTARIRQLTSHLKLKIAVMGCVVNGPGEMADADFGFVGWGEGKVALFVGKQLVERDIPYAAAPERLIELIRGHGRWTEPEASSMSDSEQLPN